MDARIENGVVEFRDANGKLCGMYHYNDDTYKSFFRGLFTPLGRDVVAFPPPEHPHHKGLQYGLCTKDVNFWEEKPDPPRLPALIGSQRNRSLDLFRRGDEVGFTQVLVWWDDVMKESFEETRTISVQQSTPAAYTWTWQTRLIAMRDVVLIKGPWAARDKDGLSVGYYGLGMRFTDAFFTEDSRLLVDGELTSVDEGLGRIAQRVALQCTGVQVTFEQRQKDPLYINLRDFVFMGLGPVPTNLTELHLAERDGLDKQYVITVEDLPA